MVSHLRNWISQKGKYGWLANRIGIRNTIIILLLIIIQYYQDAASDEADGASHAVEWSWVQDYMVPSSLVGRFVATGEDRTT